MIIIKTQNKNKTKTESFLFIEGPPIIKNNGSLFHGKEEIFLSWPEFIIM